MVAGRIISWTETSWVSWSAEEEVGCSSCSETPPGLGGVQLRSQLPPVLSLQDVLELAFSIVHDVEEYCLNFIAPTRYEVSSRGLLGWCTVPKMPL